MAVAGQFDIPSWASKPPSGLHLDVMKGDRLVQKLMIDDKKCYLFGRNPQQNDFCIDHASCSRVHAALVFHKILNKSFLYDLGSTHGTYIGNVRLEAHKPIQLHVDSRFHFGASTRQYVLRERPTHTSRPIMEELERSTSQNEGGLLGLPETDTELENLTEFNTAHNRRLQLLSIPEEEGIKKSLKRKRNPVTFNEDEQIINPEDIDPSIGRFRNLVQTVTIPVSKKTRNSSFDSGGLVPPSPSFKHQPLMSRSLSLYDDVPLEGNTNPPPSISTPYFTSLSSKYGLPVPNPAPEIEPSMEIGQPVNTLPLPTLSQPTVQMVFESSTDEPKKKRYAKEAWPGKKQGYGSTNLGSQQGVEPLPS